VRLLRVLQDGCLERIGSHRSINVDVRIVAATHRDLPAWWPRAGSGRTCGTESRVSHFPAAAAERLDDIPLLTRHFAETCGNPVRPLPVLMPSEEDYRLLQAYPWPGNVRELATVMDRAAILETAMASRWPRPWESCARHAVVAGGLAEGAYNGVEPTLGRRDTGCGASHNARPMPQNDTGQPASRPGRRYHGAISKRPSRGQGRIEGPHGAALLLNINPHTLRARMRKLGIRWSDFRSR